MSSLEKRPKSLMAQDAREQTKANLEGPVIDHLIEVIDRKIQAAIKEGKFQISDPLDGLRTPITSIQKNAVWKYYRNLGYKVTIFDGQKDCGATINWGKTP